MTAQAVADEKITAIIDDPPLLLRVIDPDDVRGYLRQVGRDKPPGWLSRLVRRPEAWPPEVPQLPLSEVEQQVQVLDIDKSWDALNACLKVLVPNGACPNLFEDGNAIFLPRDEEGPRATAFRMHEIADIANAWCAVSTEDLIRALDVVDFEGVYWGPQWAARDAGTVAYLSGHFGALQRFLRRARDCRLGAVVEIH